MEMQLRVSPVEWAIGASMPISASRSTTQSPARPATIPTAVTWAPSAAADRSTTSRPSSATCIRGMEIARQTGAPLGTVKSRARLGLLALRAAITFEYPRGQRPATAGQPRASVGGPG